MVAATGDALLPQLIAAAQEVSPDLAAARVRIAQARATGVAAGAALGPALQATGNVTRESARQVGRAGGQLATVSQAALEASWEIDVFGGRRAERDAAQERLLGTRTQWHAATGLGGGGSGGPLLPLAQLPRLLAVAAADDESRRNHCRFDGATGGRRHASAGGSRIGQRRIGAVGGTRAAAMGAV